MNKGIQQETDEKSSQKEIQTQCCSTEVEKIHVKGFSYQENYKKLKIKIPSLEQIFSQISTILEDMIEENDSHQNKTIFDAQKIPKINIHNYLQRIAKYSRISFESAILALIYIDRLITEDDEFILSHRIVLAAKFNDDLRLNNNDFSKIGGISLDELFVLEICFLKSIKFNLRVSMEEFLSYLKNIIK